MNRVVSFSWQNITAPQLWNLLSHPSGAASHLTGLLCEPWASIWLLVSQPTPLNVRNPQNRISINLLVLQRKPLSLPIFSGSIHPSTPSYASNHAQRQWFEGPQNQTRHRETLAGTLQKTQDFLCPRVLQLSKNHPEMVKTMVPWGEEDGTRATRGASTGKIRVVDSKQFVSLCGGFQTCERFATAIHPYRPSWTSPKEPVLWL